MSRDDREAERPTEFAEWLEANEGLLDIVAALTGKVSNPGKLLCRAVRLGYEAGRAEREAETGNPNPDLRVLELYYAQKDGCKKHGNGHGKICLECVADELKAREAEWQAEREVLYNKLHKILDNANVVNVCSKLVALLASGPRPLPANCPAKLNGNPPPTCRLKLGHPGDHESLQPHGILYWAQPLPEEDNQ